MESIGKLRASLSPYLEDERRTLEWSFNFVSLISLVIGILAIAAASYLDSNDAKGFGFAAIWSMFLVLFFSVLGQYVLGGAARGCAGKKESDMSNPVMTGFLLGTSFMLSLAFFLLGCVFASSDEAVVEALGAFFIMQFFFLMAFSIFATKKRHLIYGDAGWQGNVEGNAQKAEAGNAASPEISDESPVPAATVVVDEPVME